MIEINIDSEYIKLDQLLKLADAVSTGGHAKFLILEGLVKVNGEVEIKTSRYSRSWRTENKSSVKRRAFYATK